MQCVLRVMRKLALLLLAARFAPFDVRSLARFGATQRRAQQWSRVVALAKRSARGLICGAGDKRAGKTWRREMNNWLPSRFDSLNSKPSVREHRSTLNLFLHAQFAPQKAARATLISADRRPLMARLAAHR